MAGLNHDVFEEHLSVIAALKENYAHGDDTDAVAEIKAIHGELAQLCQAREEEVEKIIKSLTETVSKVEQTAVYPEPEEAHEGRLTELKSEMAESREDIASLNSELAELRQQRRELESLLRDLDRQRLHLEQMANEKEPKIRSIMSLYAHITNIAWNFDRSDRVAGTVSDKKKGDVRRFDFDPAVQDRAKIIEQLWKLMEG